MPKRKRLPKTTDYEGMGNNCGNYEIQKARPLQSLAQTDLTLPEFKILDLYLARIDSHDPDKRTVRLEKGELEKALGLSEIKQDDLENRLRHLFQIIKIKDDRKRNGFKLINLFDEADAEQDEDGLWQITLTCTDSAREYVFNIDNIGYLRYRLKNVINLTSRYSYVLFLYLLDNRFRKKWRIPLADLKTLLNCTAETYKQYKYFNDLVLKKAHKELCEKTDISFDYAPIKRGRSVVAVEFDIHTIAEQAEKEPICDNDGQTTLFPSMPFEKDYSGRTTAAEQEHFVYWSDMFGGNDDMAELCRALCFEFKHKSEYEQIFNILLRTNIKPADEYDTLACARATYLGEMYVKMCAAAERKQKKGGSIGDRFAYLVAMLEKNADVNNKGEIVTN